MSAVRSEQKSAGRGAGKPGKMLKVTQVRSAIGGTRRQRLSLRGLGLSKIGTSVIVQSNPATLGMIGSIAHLVTVED
jgi:ribosomal protein L30